MMTRLDDRVTDVREVDANEGRQMLDRSARQWLHMSGADFLRAWDAGEFADDDRLAVQQVAMLIDFAR